LLTRGNDKLGSGIWSFNLPVFTACPGASLVCQEVCYARRGRFYCDNVQRALQRNRELADSPELVGGLIAQGRQNYVRIGRIHASGDFYREAYVAKWRRIVRKCRTTTWYGYTRSWTVPDLLPGLLALAAEPNMFLWFSTDRSMPEPPRVPGVRIAWLATSDYDHPAYDVDLVFRDSKKKPMKRMSGYPVCPYEQRIDRKVTMSCTRCRICFRGLKPARKTAGKHPVTLPH